MHRTVTWTTRQVLEATGGRLVCGKPGQSFSGVAIDSRTAKPGDLFIAIRGAVHDGHRFIPEVVDKGVRGLVVQAGNIQDAPVDRWQAARIVCVAVDDTTRALGDVAAFHRNRMPASIVAVTGSTGKTTTREMTAAVISRRYDTLSSLKNFNNDIGLPLTLLRLDPEKQWAVVELGMNRPGEIRRLSEICRPDIGVITNIGPVHLEGVGSLDGVMRAKGELLEKLKPTGTAILNADDDRSLVLAAAADRKVVLFGTSPRARIRAEAIEADGTRVSFSLRLPAETVRVCLNTPGTFMVLNALAASAVGYLLGMDAADIKAGLESFQPVTGRMTLVHTPKGIHIINDTYNANPASMGAAIETLGGLKGSGRAVVVMGDMLELGGYAQGMHVQIGAEAARSRVDRLYITGRFAADVQSGAQAGGLAKDQIVTGPREAIERDLTGWLRCGDWVLVKGSRAMGMERIVERLMVWGRTDAGVSPETDPK